MLIHPTYIALKDEGILNTIDSNDFVSYLVNQISTSSWSEVVATRATALLSRCVRHKNILNNLRTSPVSLTSLLALLKTKSTSEESDKDMRDRLVLVIAAILNVDDGAEQKGKNFTLFLAIILSNRLMLM